LIRKVFRAFADWYLLPVEGLVVAEPAGTCATVRGRTFYSRLPDYPVGLRWHTEEAEEPSFRENLSLCVAYDRAVDLHNAKKKAKSIRRAT